MMKKQKKDENDWTRTVAPMLSAPLPYSSYHLISVVLISPIVFFFFNDTATTEIYTLSLHDALPISTRGFENRRYGIHHAFTNPARSRSEEHTSELQSRRDLVCRLLLEKKKKKK